MTFTLTIAVICIGIAAVFYIRDNVGKASFWMLAAIFTALIGG